MKTYLPLLVIGLILLSLNIIMYLLLTGLTPRDLFQAVFYQSTTLLIAYGTLKFRDYLNELED